MIMKNQINYVSVYITERIASWNEEWKTERQEEQWPFSPLPSLHPLPTLVTEPSRSPRRSINIHCNSEIRKLISHKGNGWVSVLSDATKARFTIWCRLHEVQNWECTLQSSMHTFFKPLFLLFYVIHRTHSLTERNLLLCGQSQPCTNCFVTDVFFSCFVKRET
jgi:hypothetical protein